MHFYKALCMCFHLTLLPPSWAPPPSFTLLGPSPSWAPPPPLVKVGQLLTAAEMQLTSAQPIAQTLPRLRLQAAKHEELQTSMAPIVQHLKDIQQSVKDLKDGGCDLSPDLMNLVKRFEKRWMDVSRYAHNRSVRLNESLSKFGSVPVRDGGELGMLDVRKGGTATGICCIGLLKTHALALWLVIVSSPSHTHLHIHTHTHTHTHT